MAAFWIVGGVVSLLTVAAAAWIFVAQSVERAAYAVVETDGAIEIREYPAHVAAEVRRRGPRWEAVNAGFPPLARYIFAREREGEKIAMTAPVTQRRAAEIEGASLVTAQSVRADGEWAVRFIMPTAYAFEDLPAPSGDDVRLIEVGPQRRAAIRFSGVATDDSIAHQEDALRDWLDARGLSAEGPPIYAYYNDPMTPGFLRRNEVLIDLAPTD